jgi:hypothetical protein
MASQPETSSSARKVAPVYIPFLLPVMMMVPMMMMVVRMLHPHHHLSLGRDRRYAAEEEESLGCRRFLKLRRLLLCRNERSSNDRGHKSPESIYL